MKLLHFCLSILLFTSCIDKDFSTDYTATLINNTDHTISIYCYDGRKITDSTTIASSESFEIANGSKWGMDLDDGFTTKYTGDSMLVVFDDSLYTMHYSDVENHSAKSYYTWTSPRNLANQSNFDFTYEDQSRYHRVSKYTYTFIEKDYVDAEP